jgi:DNA-binding transcriptional ArsR family regulator
MESVLRRVLAGTEGGSNRARLLRAVAERPRNAHQLADALDLNYKTVTHHLRVLEENGVLASSGQDYGEVYLPSDAVRRHWDTVEEIIEQVEGTAP